MNSYVVHVNAAWFVTLVWANGSETAGPFDCREDAEMMALRWEV